MVRARIAVSRIFQSIAAALETSLILLLASTSAPAQEGQKSVPLMASWDVGIWTAGATGEENTNSFTEAQIWTAGFFLGHGITGEIGRGWRRGRLELPGCAELRALSSLSATGGSELIIRRSLVRVQPPPPIKSAPSKTIFLLRCAYSRPARMCSIAPHD